MDLRQFEAFLVVAEELHFGRAAERLYVAQSALSRMIRSFEKELGTDLFERTTRKVRLTKSGEALLEPAQAIQVHARGVRRIAKTAQLGQIGNVRVGFGGTTGYRIVASLIREVSIRQPGITLQLHPRAFAGEATTMLRDGELDLAVVSLPAPPGIVTHHVVDQDVVVALPADHRLASEAELSMKWLSSDRFVSYPAAHGSHVRDAMVRLCSAAGFVPDIAQEAPDPFSLLTLVGAGVGVAVVVGSSRSVQIEGVRYVPVAGTSLTLPLGLGWRESNPSLALQNVVGIVRDALDSERVNGWA